MHIFHPPQSVYGLPTENVFYIADSANQTVAEGFIIPLFRPQLFPERPVNLYLSIRSQGPGKDMLMGALLARVRQMREQCANMPVRVYTQVGPQDAQGMAFYLENGFVSDDALDVFRLSMPDARAAAPMGYDMNYVPINNQAELTGFIDRMNTYRLNAINPAMMQRYMSLPHFFAIYMRRGSEIVGEIAFTGHGPNAQLIGLYVVPNYRRLGLAKSLIATGMQILASRGVTNVEAEVMRRNAPQMALARSCKAGPVRRICFYPGMNYD